MGTDDFAWGPNNQFKFPLLGGTGEFYRRFAAPLQGHYTVNKKLDFIKHGPQGMPLQRRAGGEI